jgi:DNA-binding MarR family transcriptional regulator
MEEVVARTSAETGKFDPASDADPADGLAGWVLPGLDFPTFRIAQIGKILDRATLRQMGEQGELSYPEWRVLARLATNPDSTVGQIADRAWVDRAEVSRAAAALEARGLTRRKRNPQDARTPLLSCTAEGIDVYHRVLEQRQAFHRKLVANLSEEESRLFDAILMKIAREAVKLASRS